MKIERCKMVTQSPCGKNRVTWMPINVAWPAARGIARDSHFSVILYGKFAVARFNYDGSGSVVWNELSTEPGKTTSFGENVTVCIN